jgi:hypothetical protein
VKKNSTWLKKQRHQSKNEAIFGGKIGKTGAKKLIYTSFFFTTKLKKKYCYFSSDL